MTTTAHEDQFTVAPEPVHQPYSTADILRRNVADLEIALRKQTERAEKAEVELEMLREQRPAGYVFGDWRGATTISAVKSSHFNTPLYAKPIPVATPAVPAPSVPDGDDFNGSTPHLIQCMEALVRLDADGVLVPHGIGRSASRLLSAAANRLRKQTAPIPEEWRKVMARLLDTFERCEAGFHPHVEIRLAVRDEARALLQSAEVTK